MIKKEEEEEAVHKFIFSIAGLIFKRINCWYKM